MKLGLVLAGGGGKGGYQIGVWKYLKETGLDEKISVISGTSVGGLNAVLIANGDYNVAEKIWTTEIDDKILDTNSLDNRNLALFSRTGLLQIIDKYISLSRIKKCGKQIYVTSHSMLEMHTQYHHLNHCSPNEIKQWLCATSAIPGAFQPEMIKGDVHFDGGIQDNVPIKPLIKEQCTHALIIGLNDSQEDFSGYNIKTVTISPSEDLGNVLTGVMDFSLENARKRINLGYSDCKNIKANRLRIRSLMETNMNMETNMDNGQISMAEKINDMNDKQIMLETLKRLCRHKKEVKYLQCNIILFSVPGDALMKDLSEFGGWRFQEHTLFHWIRIVDENGETKAWGEKDKLLPKCKNYLINKLEE